MTRRQILLRLYIEECKISLFVLGGGYAIIIMADDVFGRRLKWLEEGELLEKLPVFQTIPGLIAGNAGIYVGLKMGGMLGAAVALAGVATPSLIIITAIAMGFNWLPMDNPFVQGAFIGLRSAFCGLILAAIIKTWKKSMKGVYAYICLLVCCVSIIAFKRPSQYFLLGAILFGIMTHTIILPLFNAIAKRKVNA